MFVLSLMVAAALAGLLAATLPQWKRALPASKPYTRLAGGPIREVACESGALTVQWVNIPGNPRASDIVEFSRAEELSLLEFGDRYVAATAAMRGSSWCFRSLKPYGWLFRCGLWRVRVVLAVPIALAALVAWRTRQRWPPTCCQRCGYGRAGLSRSALCPECGAPSA